MKKEKFSKFVTLRYLKIVRFPITLLVFLESPQCIGVHTLALWHFTKIKSSFATKFCNWKLLFATILTILVAKISYLYNNFSSSVWNHVIKVIWILNIFLNENWIKLKWKKLVESRCIHGTIGKILNG